MFLEEVLERSVRCAPKRGRTGPCRALGPMLSPEPSALDTYLTKANERAKHDAHDRLRSFMETVQPRPGARSRHTFHRSHNHALRLFAALALLGLSALPIDRNSITAVEADVFRVVNGWPGALYPVVWAVMQFGNLLATPVSAIAAFATRRVRLGVDLLIAGGGAWLFAKVVKEYVNRGRPAAFLDDVILRSAPAGGHGSVAGHAGTGFAPGTVGPPHPPPR